MGCATEAGILTTALAFGLSIVAMAYVIGNVSGCHVNPAVSLACLIDGRMTLKDFCGYVIAQVLGAIAGSGILYGIVACTGKAVDGYGANGYGTSISLIGALIVEVILTCVFIYTILGVTADEKKGSVAGTSVNPARSLSAAIFSGAIAMSQVWVFIVGPFVGAALAAVLYRLLNKEEK